MTPQQATAAPLLGWDPLKEATDEEFVLAAQKREIHNILKSYTGYYDLFAELIQNALDAVEKRAEEGDINYKPAIWITIDIPNETISVTDNGCAMTEAQFRAFLKPGYSFKEGGGTRGSKGVGATYLAYGFNYLEIATKIDGKSACSGVLENGRSWLEDMSNVVGRPRVQPVTNTHGVRIDRQRYLLHVEVDWERNPPAQFAVFHCQNGRRLDVLTAGTHSIGRHLYFE
ncbi:MAG TPA: ATP-binding protein [Clostridia bacterium]|nr:ATP-binding protein [Clostridia bacterium]